MVITARVRFFTWLVAITCAAAVPITVAICLHAPPTPPEPPGPCIEKAELRSISDSAWLCAPGARIEAWPSGSLFLMKCVCPPPPAFVDAGAR